MVKKLLVLLIFIGILISGCSEPPLEFIGKKLKLSQGPSDCKENQYYDASKGKCLKIINECYANEDCSKYETCVRKAIDTRLACRVGEECPDWYHNVCEITEETKKYCKQNSDCVWAIRPDACCYCPEIYNNDFINFDSELVIYEEGKDYSLFRTADCSRVACAPCAGVSELECVNNQCQRKKEIETEEWVHDIFYNSQCYNANKEKFGTSEISFKIEQIKNVSVIKTHKIYKTDEGNLTSINILWYQEQVPIGDNLLTAYDVIETLNATVWRVQGGIFAHVEEGGVVVGGGTFYGCLVIIDKYSSRILTEGWYGYG